MKIITISGTNIGMKIMGLSILWMSAALMTAMVARADIYSWQDDQGVIHYSNYDVPPQAALYMKEPAKVSPAPETEIRQSPSRAELDVEAIRQQAKTEARIEEANRKLNQALEKVDELTDKVSQSQAQANAAAEAARQAAVAAESGAQAASYYNSGVTERVVVHSTPYYPYRNKKNSLHHRKPYYFGPNKNRHSYYNGGGRSKIDKHKQGRHRVHRSRHDPIIRQESRIPKAYGVRGKSRRIPKAYGIR